MHSSVLDQTREGLQTSPNNGVGGGTYEDRSRHRNYPAAEQLFEVAPADMLFEYGRLESGMEQLIGELTPRQLNPGLRVVVTLPGDQINAETQSLLQRAIGRYCLQRLRQTELIRSAQWQDVMSALRVGCVLFVIAVLLSYYFNRSGLSALANQFIGDGFFAVIAWVGLWYPLDALVHYRRQTARDKKVLSFIGSMELSLRAERPET
jgi:hypothetical protein